MRDGGGGRGARNGTGPAEQAGAGAQRPDTAAKRPGPPVTQLISAAEATWVQLLTGLGAVEFAQLLETLRPLAGDEGPRAGRRWTLCLGDRVLLVVAYWRTDLTMREVAALFGVSKSAADRIVGHLGPHLEFTSTLRRRRCRLIVRTHRTTDTDTVPPPAHPRDTDCSDCSQP
ncbi:transposase family protein [Kitasatospora sp. NBC_00374]|uniref:helix-turn-helix domain-containing protein n=1 Tax=Kitasatospora sp. NBC_00374 TaxID=2975964 RepID=UPI0030E04B0A